MTPRHSEIATLAILVVLLAGCGQKAAKTGEPTPTPTASASAEQPTVQEPRPPDSPPASAPRSVTASASSPHPAPSASGPQSSDEFTEEMALQDVFFEAGRTDIGPSRARFMKENARWINENPSFWVLIEGHTDARGTQESRFAIADRRAKAAARFLLEEGVSNTRLFTISHGSERPVCVETTDGCAARNRRVHFRVKKQ